MDNGHKPWKCGRGHTLGHVAPIEGIRRLFLYRFADVPENVAGILTGLGCWTCSKCNTTREWHAGQDAIEELLEKRKKFREIDANP